MILLILVFAVGFIAMFPLKKLAQKVYNDTGYNAVKGWTKFLTILFGLANIFLAFVLSVVIETHDYIFAIGIIGVLLLFILLLALVNKKAGLKRAILLAILQSISGSIMIFVLFIHHAFGGILSSNVLDILSINEDISNAQ